MLVTTTTVLEATVLDTADTNTGLQSYPGSLPVQSGLQYVSLSTDEQGGLSKAIHAVSSRIRDHILISGLQSLSCRTPPDFCHHALGTEFHPNEAFPLHGS